MVDVPSPGGLTLRLRALAERAHVYGIRMEPDGGDNGKHPALPMSSEDD